MNHVTYGMIEETYICGSERRASYGIAAFAHAKQTQTACIVAAVHDIGSDFEEIRSLVEKCNRQELPVVHLQDVISDFFAK